MTDDLQALQAETDAALAAATDLRAWDAIRIAVLGRNGKLTALLRDMGKIPAEQKRERGAALNRLKDALTEAIEARRRALDSGDSTRASPPRASTPRCRLGRARPD